MSIAFERAKKTFLGFLKARLKSNNTIRNYASDLESFGKFCSQANIDFQKISLSELEHYHHELKKQGLKANSRRRKIITAKAFLRYLSGRMDVSTVGSERVVPPERVERIPKLVSIKIVEFIRTDQDKLGTNEPIGLRNKGIIGVLIDTGMLVTEALALKVSDCTLLDSKEMLLKISGKRTRVVTVSERTAQDILKLIKHLPEAGPLFYGYSRTKRNIEKLSSRGIEFLFKHWSKKYHAPSLSPKILRHLYIIKELRSGRSENEIKEKLGLKSFYSFRVYNEFLKTENISVQIQDSSHI